MYRKEGCKAKMYTVKLGPGDIKEGGRKTQISFECTFYRAKTDYYEQLHFGSLHDSAVSKGTLLETWVFLGYRFGMV